MHEVLVNCLFKLAQEKSVVRWNDCPNMTIAVDLGHKATKQTKTNKAGIHNMLVRIANREDPDQTASCEAVWSGSALFVYAFIFQNFRTLTSCQIILKHLIFWKNVSGIPLECQTVWSNGSRSCASSCQVLSAHLQRKIMVSEKHVNFIKHRKTEDFLFVLGCIK